MSLNRISRPALRMAAAMLVISLTSLSANAQVRPFLVAGSGAAPIGVSLFGAVSPHDSTGLSTPIGFYTGDRGRFIALTPPDAALSGTFKGSFVFEELFGKDELFCTYGDTDNGAASAGTYQIFDVGGGNVIVVFLAEFNPDADQSTGKYKRVQDGSLTMLAVTDPFPLAIDPDTGFSPPFEYSWVGKGWLKFRRGR